MACVTEKSYVDSNKQVKSLDFDKEEAAKSRLLLGLEYLKNQNLPQAKANLDKAAEFAPNRADVHYSLAYYFQTVGDINQADASYQKALAIEPNNPNTLNNYAVFLCQNGQVTQAKEYFKQAIKTPGYSQVGESYLNLAYCEIAQSQYSKALENVTTASKYDPKSTEIMLVAAQLHYGFGNLSSALSWLNELEAVGGLNADGLMLAIVLARASNLADSAASFEQQLLVQFPDTLQATLVRNQKYQDSEPQKLRRDIESTMPNLVNQSPQSSDVAILNSALGSANMVNESLVRDGIHALNIIEKESSLPEEEVVYDASESKDLTVVERTPWLEITTPKVNIPRYEVKSGENLYRVSIKFNIQMSTLMKWNNLKKQQVNAGERLYIRNPDVYHVVETDEKLSIIADKLNINLDDIMRWHGVSHDGLVKAKTKIITVDPEQFK